MLHLIPAPKKIVKHTENLLRKTLFFSEAPIDPRLKKQIDKLPLAEDGIPLTVKYGSEENAESYSLTVSNAGIRLSADGVRGAFYGIQTLRQIFEHDVIPCCEIEDAPDMEYRGFYHDVTRGKVPKLETLKWLIDQLAYCKYNSLQLYIEHAYEFNEYKDSIERTGFLTAEEMRALDAYCIENFIDFIPSLATFGHLYELLEKPRYKHLAEVENYQSDKIAWRERAEHHTIDPTNPESFELIKSLLDQYIPLFSSGKFNICCDETFDLKNGRHKDQDPGELYIRFVNKIIDYVKSRGKQVMMWGDILLEHPERVHDLSDDVILLTWDYASFPRISHVERFFSLGRTQIVCPGSSAWGRLLEHMPGALSNIRHMVNAAHVYGAYGMLMTNWGDIGNPATIRLSACSLFFAGAKSWNVRTVEETFLPDMDSLIYKTKGATSIVGTLSIMNEKISWYTLAFVYSNRTHTGQLPVTLPTEETVVSCHETLLATIDTLKNAVWTEDEYRQDLLTAAEGLLLMTEIFAKLIGAEVPFTADTEIWLAKYRAAWLRLNQEPELCEIEKMFRHFAKLFT